MSDLILVNGNVITMDPKFPKARAIAVKDGKVVGISGSEDLRQFKQHNTDVIDCHGNTVLPGFIDAHFHLFAFAKSLVTLDLEPRNQVRSITDIQNKIRQTLQTLPPGKWIRARGYHEFCLKEKRHPTRWDLDAVTTLHPVKVTHLTGQAHVLNSMALNLLDISKERGDPPEGIIDRDIKTGEPTGLLYGMSNYLAERIPPMDRDQIEYGIKLASQKLTSLGITSIQDASSRNDSKRWEVLGDWKERGLLSPRVSMILGYPYFHEYGELAQQADGTGNQIHLGGVKIVVHETTGRLTPSQLELNDMVFRIHQAGCQAVLHAIEERTVEAACSAVEYALQRQPRVDHRHRIEHCSVCPPVLAKRIASLGILVVTQPSFIFYHGERYLKTVPGSQLPHLYPINTLLRYNVRVAGSCDCPIVPPNPLIGIYSATSRTSETGESIVPKERITLMEALRMVTHDAAVATREEDIKGSITIGKAADLVVLAGDLDKLPADKIKDLEVSTTIQDGTIIYDRTG
jgi:predicted amidohydrolase YtcJ